MRTAKLLRSARATTVVLATAFLVSCASSEPPSESTRRSNDPVSTAGPKKPWSEFQAPLPRYPKSEDLSEFKIGGKTNFRFFTDLDSVRVDADQVVRLTVVARSPSGAENVSFEGIHCESAEYKVYAYGSSDKTWVSPRDPKWQKIQRRTQNNVRDSLYHYYLCPNGFPQRNTKNTVMILERGVPYFGDYRRF